MIGLTKLMTLTCKRINSQKIATTEQLFQFSGQLYEQIDVVAMGSPLGPLMSNVFLCHLEDKLTRDGVMPRLYKRSVSLPFTDQT